MDENEQDHLASAPPASLGADVPVCRALPEQVELRDATGDGEDGSPGTLFGHFSTFDDWYEINSWFEGNFLERVAPGAFKRTLKNRSDQSPIRVLLEHGFDPQVGDKPLGVPSVMEERDGGPYAEVPLFDTSYNRDLAPALRAGAYGQSFRFVVLRDEWEEEPAPSDANPKGIPQRTIKEVRVIEFGPTVFPANPAADAGLRSTTDAFYERLRSRQPDKYAELVARTASIRLPQTPPPADAEAGGPQYPSRGRRRAGGTQHRGPADRALRGLASTGTAGRQPCKALRRPASVALHGTRPTQPREEPSWTRRTCPSRSARLARRRSPRAARRSTTTTGVPSFRTTSSTSGTICAPSTPTTTRPSSRPRSA